MIFNVQDKKYGAKGNGVVDDTKAIQACIDDSLGDDIESAKVRVRDARGPIYLPSGTYKLSAPLKIYSGQGIKFHGDGSSTRLYPTASMDAVLDINGVAYSTFRDFQIQGDGKTEAITNAIYYYYDPDVAYRSTTRNIFDNILIHNTRCVTGFRAGKIGSGTQVDQTTYRDLTIYGDFGYAWSNSGWYRNGFFVGDNAFGNNLVHNSYNSVFAGWNNGVVVACSNFGMFGGSFGQNGVDVYAKTLAYLTVQGIRSESSRQLLRSDTTGSHAALFNLSDIIWSTNNMQADGSFIEMNANGSLNITNLQLINGGDHAKIRARPIMKLSLRLNGIASQSSFEDFLDVSSQVSTTADGYYQYDDKIGFRAFTTGR